MMTCGTRMASDLSKHRSPPRILEKIAPIQVPEAELRFKSLNLRKKRDINKWCDQLAVDLWDSNPLLTKEKQLTKLMVLLSDLAPNLVRTSLHQSV